MHDPSLVAQVQQRIAATEQTYGRSPGSVSLLVVSKTRSPSEILAVNQAGPSQFGENYLQEALPKIHALTGHTLEWHFIGAVQSNKAEPIARHFEWVHTVDREKIAAHLNQHRPLDKPPLNVCLQVNISGESSKSGIRLNELPALVSAIAGYPRLRLRGLMTLPAPTTDFAVQRQAFRLLANAFYELKQLGYPLDTLSMGTSEDFIAAIAEGATLVRLGTAVFGPRPVKSAK
jgi:PLP dependent protein